MCFPSARSLCYVLVLIFLVAVTCAQSAGLPKSITLSYESLLPGSQSVKPLATVFYDPETLSTSLSSWTPPSLDSLKPTTAQPTSLHILKILVPSGSSTLTSLGTFNETLIQNIDLRLSPSGDGTVFSASVYASTPFVEVVPGGSKPKSKAEQKVVAQKKTEANAGARVKLVSATRGPMPKFTSKKPPVIGADGKEQPAPEELEKSFFQKYWWLFAVVALLAMAGGGDK